MADSDELLKACAAGDQRAWRVLVDSHAGLVFATARRQGLTEDECQDVAQMVFATLARRIDSIQRANALPAWLITTSQRAAWRITKARRRASEAAAASARQSSEAVALNEETDELDRLQRIHALKGGMGELGQRCRRLLEMLYFDRVEHTYEQIARELEVPMGSIGPTRQRCLASLAQILKRMEADLA